VVDRDAACATAPAAAEPDADRSVDESGSWRRVTTARAHGLAIDAAPA
jgi:hypothetical protein